MKSVKKYTSAALCVLALSALLASCREAEEPAGLGETLPPATETAVSILTAPEKGLSPEDAALADRAAEILWEEYDLPAREHFDTEVRRHVSNGRASVEFELHIGGYRTWESYTVYFETDGSVRKVSDSSMGEYSRFLENATSERMSAAEAALTERLAEYGEHSGYYLTVDDEGYLCLSAEVIVELTPSLLAGLFSEGGCGVDHEHKFFNERICGANE